MKKKPAALVCRRCFTEEPTNRFYTLVDFSAIQPDAAMRHPRPWISARNPSHPGQTANDFENLQLMIAHPWC